MAVVFLFGLLTACHHKAPMAKTTETVTKVAIDTTPVTKSQIIIPISSLPSTVDMEADLDIQSPDFSQNVTAKIKFKKLDSTWISLTGIFGIEGARILITKDTFHMLDRINRKYIVGPVSQSYRIIPFNLDLLSFQYLLMGAVTYPIDSSFYITANKDTLYCEKNQQNIWRKSTWHKNKLIYFTEKDLSSGYNIKGFLFDRSQSATPYRRKYTITNHQQEYQIDFKITSLEENKPIDFKFELSGKYEKIQL